MEVFRSLFNIKDQSLPGGKANRVSVEPMTESQMCALVNMATEKVEQSQKSMAAVIKAAGHEMARFARTLYYKNGVSKITTEAEFQALLLYCGGKSGNGQHVSEGLQKDAGDKFINEVGQQCLKAIAVQDRSLRQKVPLNCMILKLTIYRIKRHIAYQLYFIKSK